jgi:hypothetical protein
VTVDETGVHETGVRGVVYHFSEDPTLRRFAPHVPSSNPSQPPAVFAIDAEHAPLYWFPRDCPRISVWAYTAEQQELLTATFASEASRIVATEMSWLPGIRDTVLYRYTFDAADFEPWSLADGQYVSDHVVAPLTIEPLTDLLGQHVAANVELRFTPRLGALTDAMLASGLPFSFVRIRNATR